MKAIAAMPKGQQYLMFDSCRLEELATLADVGPRRPSWTFAPHRTVCCWMSKC